jgi:hypothetical protein
MKRIAVLLALLCTGLLISSFALADDGGKGKNKASTTSASTTTAKAGKKKCKNVSLKGTAAATTFTITADRSNKAGRELNGKPVTLKFQGKVNINARMCSETSGAAGAAGATFELRNMKVAKPVAAESGD